MTFYRLLDKNNKVIARHCIMAGPLDYARHLDALMKLKETVRDLPDTARVAIYEHAGESPACVVDVQDFMRNLNVEIRVYKNYSMP